MTLILPTVTVTNPIDTITGYWAIAMSVEETAAITGHTVEFVAQTYSDIDTECRRLCAVDHPAPYIYQR